MLPDFSPIAPTGGYLVAPDTDLEFLFTGWHSADGSNWFQNKMREPDIWDNYIDLRTEDADDGDYDDLVIRLRMEMMTNNP